MATTPSVRRQRVFLTVIGVAVIATLAFSFLGDRGTPPAGGTGEGPQTGPQGQGQGSAAVEAAPPASPPAYLAWTLGGFPSEFRARVRTMRSLDAAVVLAGDTRWMTRSTDGNGRVVDEPAGSFAFPIDAFAVNPIEYAPFLPDEVRDEVIGALEDGKGVLSTRSAALRRLEVGGSMRFGNQDVEIGAIAPDEVIGWSELLVSRDLGTELGIVDDRYLLAMPAGHPNLERFSQELAPLLAPETAIRVEKPGGSAFMRVASGVNPPIVLKEVFGEFAARPDERDPSQLTIQPAWVERHIATRAVPVLGRVTCNVAFFPALRAALAQVEREGLASSLTTYNGCWNARTVARSPTAPPSFHAYGAAIDINAAANAYGAVPTMNEGVVKMFERFGFTWGGDFLIPDGMHFEYGRSREAA